MKTLILVALTVSAISAYGQNGYIKLNNDSTLIGYLRYYVSFQDGHQGIELWRTKQDKEPLRISKERISEYAIKKDTFKVLHQYTPFYDSHLYFEVIDAKRKLRGKINLYVIENNKNRVSSYTGGGVLPAVIDYSLGNQAFIYILEDSKTGVLKALPSHNGKLQESLMEIFPEKYILKYAEVKGKIKYKSVPDVVKLYNSK